MAERQAELESGSGFAGDAPEPRPSTFRIALPVRACQ